MPARGPIIRWMSLLACVMPAVACCAWGAGLAGPPGRPDDPSPTEAATQPARPARADNPSQLKAPRPDVPSWPAPGSPSSPDDDILMRAILDRPPVPVTLVRGATPEGPPPPKLPDDGTMVIDRRARLSRDSRNGWFAFRFEEDPALSPEQPRWALPCQMLEKMEEYAARDANCAFRISGENVVYESKCYLMLGKAIVEGPRPPAPPPGAPKPKPFPVVAPAGTQPAAATSPSARTTRPAGGPTADDILWKLLQERPGIPVTVPARPVVGPDHPSVAPVTGKPIWSDQVWLIVDRLVRVLRDKRGAWYEVHFESDNTLREAPVRVLPSSLLENVEDGQKFRISGIVTLYKGKRYILLRKALRERQMGQLELAN